MGKRLFIGIGALIVALAIALAAARFFYGDDIAAFLWQHEGWARIAVAFDRSDANLAMEIGNAEFGGETYDLPAALAAFRKAVAIEPGVLWGHYEIARIFFVDDELPQALAQANLELHYNPENLRTLYVRGLIEGYSGQYVAAEEDLRQFVAWAPTEWAGYNDLGWILLQEGKYSDAVEDINNAQISAMDASTNPWLWNTLGVAQLGLSDDTDALASFQKAGTLAASMTLADWQQAYPGDAPSSDQSGLAAFRTAIAENIAKAQEGADQ